jgi:hypothetical protein
MAAGNVSIIERIINAPTDEDGLKQYVEKVSAKE